MSALERPAVATGRERLGLVADTIGDRRGKVVMPAGTATSV